MPSPILVAPLRSRGILVNDTHSKLNPCRVHAMVKPGSLETLQETVVGAAAQNRPVCVAGARHAMGGQAFRDGACLIDVTGMGRVLNLDLRNGLVEVEAGATWPQLLTQLHGAQPDRADCWTIAQKQTGADRLTLGGAVTANIHGRGLQMRPFVGDVESLMVVDAQGRAVRCSRNEHADLLRLVIGGYGLFGIVYSATLRLVRRRKMRRLVHIICVDELMEAFNDRIRSGCVYGDFQYMTDERSPDFLRKGVLACYQPVPHDTPIPPGQRELTERDWSELLWLAHTAKARAYHAYVSHYRSTHGQVYGSDKLQCSTYLDDYHVKLDERLGAPHPGSEMITEICVPRSALPDFLSAVADDFRHHGVNVIYGTIRLIERDEETFLAWTREPWACVIFNLHVDHTPAGLVHAADAFRRLIDHAIAFHGTYYLTYHRFATREQLLACYPNFPDFLRMKLRHDPEERFQSDWYRNYTARIWQLNGAS
jgi:FAD/FMN-containing dehydrogenase